MTRHLPAGALLDDRFLIDAPVGEGGMAVVYRARDLLQQRPVAVKLLHADTSSAFAKDHFQREAEILAALHHPHIVAYLAHGSTPAGEPYLAMEWLEGEDLGRRLRRGPLPLAQVLRLGAILAGTLRATHERGIVHRDLKPGNLFLRGGAVEHVMLLDFGVARRMSASGALTRTGTGTVVGTPEYMAPEQVRGERAVGPAADIFALGCVLYECLGGRSPFLAEHVVAVLARILFEEAADIRALRPGVPDEVAALLARTLAKDPDQRIADGAALLAEWSLLPRCAGPEDAATDPGAARPEGLRGDLQELLSVIVASAEAAVAPGERSARVATGEVLGASQRDLLAALRGMGGHADFLLDGSLVAVFRGFGSATDQAAQAAQAALLIRDRWPGGHVAVTTGRGARPGEVPMGEALDRAARLIVGETLAAGGPATAGSLVLDEVTSGLIAGRFEVEKRGQGIFALRGTRATPDETRPLLGRPTPCVGRERELAQLDGILSATLDEPLGAAVIVTGPPGSGKSRLRHEFLRRVQAQGRDVLVLLARGTPLSMGTAFGLVGQALRGLCGVQDGDSPELRRQRFGDRIARHLPAAQVGRVVSFLSELCQIDAGDEISEPVRAARRDPGMMHEQLSRALCDFLAAECAVRPVLLILEDLHWGDGPSTRLLDAALGELAEQPLLIVALARPEVHEHLPRLWSRRQRHELPLWGLPRRACERLIREVLGERLTREDEARIIAQAAGNALFLEELIRAAAEGHSGGGAETVMAMLQARLSCLAAGPRTALCAASVFGRVFWRGGVAALLTRGDTAAADSFFPQLIDQEILQMHPDTRLAGEVEYGFRHDLVRDAAYSLLGEQDRLLGHYLAAQYLDQAGERDALTIAEHYRLGGSMQRAAGWYHRAAEQALEGNELQAAHDRAQLALDAGAQGVDRGRLYGLQAAAAAWRRDEPGTSDRAERALQTLVPGTPDWYQCAAHLIVSSGRLRQWDPVQRWLQAVRTTPPQQGAVPALTLCLSRAGYMFMMQGRLAEMKQIADEIDARAPDLPESESMAQAQLNHFRSGCSISTGDLIVGLRYLEQAIAAFERAGDQRSALLERSNLACSYIESGQIEEAERILRHNLAQCEGARSPSARNLSLVILGYALTFFPEKHDESRARLHDAIDRSAAAQDQRHQGWARSALARLLYLQGRYAESEAEARRALELMAGAPPFQSWPLGWLARALVRLGRAEEGLACAEQALEKLRTMGTFTMDMSVPALAQIEALRALHRTEAADEAARAAARRVRRRAERLRDPVWQARLLTHPESAQILAACPPEPR